MEDNSKKSAIDKLFKVLMSGLSFFWDLLKTALIVGIAAFVIRFFLIEPFIVQGSSMEPNYHNMDYLLIEKISDNIKNHYQRGAVVVFHPPSDPDQNYIKRIVGLPNEKIFIKENQVIIQNSNNPKGFILDEPYLETDSVTEGTKKAQMGPNEYYLLGDNRANSKDSRSFGTISENQIIGRAWIKAFSQDGLKLITTPNY